MNREQILAMEAGGELSQKVAEEIMKECYHQHWDGDKDSITCLKCGESRFYHQRSQAYSTDISAAFQVEEKIKELKLIEQYANQLIFLATTLSMNARQVLFAVAHASPEIRCKAALLAKLEVRE